MAAGAPRRFARPSALRWCGFRSVEKDIGGKLIFFNYLPAGSYFGEMSLIDGGRRTATVRATIRSEVVRLPICGKGYRREAHFSQLFAGRFLLRRDVPD